MVKEGNVETKTNQSNNKEAPTPSHSAQATHSHNAGNDSDSSSEESDDDLNLEGVLVRNSDISDEEDDETSSSDNDVNDAKVATARLIESDNVAKKSKRNQFSSENTTNRPKRKKKTNDETLEVDFTFCDMDEKYFHGLKSLLNSTSTVYQEHSSALADLMIENISIGTVVGTSLEDESEADVFGFASVLNVSTYHESPSIQFLKSFCMKHCPAEHQKELEVCLSGTTKRPAGFFLHSRMINMPLEIVGVLHEQLVLDMDWAVNNSDGDDTERKALDFGAFVRLAPCEKESGGGSIIYKYFDDEIFAGQSEFCYTVNAPKSYSKEDKQLITVMVLTKTGHRAAMKDLKRLISGQ